MGFDGPAKGLARSFDNSPATHCNALRPLQVPLQVAYRDFPALNVAQIFGPVLALAGNPLAAQDIDAQRYRIVNTGNSRIYGRTGKVWFIALR